MFAGFDFVFEETSGITWFTCKKDHCGCCVSGRRRDGMEKGGGQVGGATAVVQARSDGDPDWGTRRR